MDSEIERRINPYSRCGPQSKYKLPLRIMHHVHHDDIINQLIIITSSPPRRVHDPSIMMLAVKVVRLRHALTTYLETRVG